MELQDKEVQEYRSEVIQCLIRYGGLDEVDARLRVEDSGLLEVAGDVDRFLLFHEYPYYWAMIILHGTEFWHENPSLWPPPDDYFDWSNDGSY